jgi:hypothetical protein
MIRDAGLHVAESLTRGVTGPPLPVWACVALVVGLSAACYWLVFSAISWILG